MMLVFAVSLVVVIALVLIGAETVCRTLERIDRHDSMAECHSREPT